MYIHIYVYTHTYIYIYMYIRYNVTPITSAQKKSNVKNDRWHFCKLSDFFNVCLFQVRRNLTSVCSRSDVI